MVTNLERLKLVTLISKEIEESVKCYEEAKRKKGYAPMTGFDIDNFNSRGAIKRRIVLLREELTRLSKLL